MRLPSSIGSGLAALGVAAALLVATAAPAEAWWGRRGDRGGRFFKKPVRHCRAVPEINPGAAGTAIALVSGGLAILRDRRRRGR